MFKPQVFASLHDLILSDAFLSTLEPWELDHLERVVKEEKARRKAAPWN